MKGPLEQRSAGVLLHVTSLPGPGDSGVLGAEAYRFVDFLEAAGFGVWQMLPLGPVDACGSPYRLRSAHAGNPHLIGSVGYCAERVPAPAVAHGDTPRARLAAYRAFEQSATPRQRRCFAHFVRAERHWLLPYALFEVCRTRYDAAPWWQWPAPLRRASSAALREALATQRIEWRAIALEQYVFECQWSALRQYANTRGIRLFGDLPLYVDLDSADVWWHRALFRVDDQGQPAAVAGVPPDYFSADGQLWGNPLYDWERMRADGFRWWIDRVRRELVRFDLLRIDHFRGLESYWEVPAGAATAREGRWCQAPGAELLASLRDELGALPFVAEDLGLITQAVLALRDEFGLPGMRVLQFAFDGTPNNPHLPCNHVSNSVVYTGTHDNDTLWGWYAGLSDVERSAVAQALSVTPGSLPQALIDAAYASPARLAVLPMQDLLELGSHARMNTPGTTQGNWDWRFSWKELPSDLVARCRRRAVESERLSGA